MGLMLIPVFRTQVADVGAQTTGEFLAYALETIEEIASDEGLTPLSAFSDQREIPENFDGPPWELDEVLGPCNDWYVPEEGKSAFLELARAIREDSRVAARLEAPDAVVEELMDLARLMEVAKKAGSTFRLDLA